MRIVSAAEAVAGIASGQQVFVHGGAATPSVLLDALVARAPELEAVSMVHFHTEGPAPHLAPEMAPHFRHKALFIGANARLAVNEGRADYVPVFLSDVPDLFTSGTLPLDAVLLNVTRPDAHGFCSLGPSVDAALAASRAAKVVIAQLNASMPRTLGDTFIHVSQIDFGVEVDIPPYEHAEAPIGDVERRIGENVAELVQDGATLQLGIGAIPSATALALRDKRDLGIHTEMFTDAVIDLVECGAITGARKEINRGKIVSAFLMGTRAPLSVRRRQPDGRAAPGRLHERHRRDPPLQPDGGDQLRDRGRCDRAGGRRLDRAALLLRRGRADGLHSWRRARREGRAIIALPSTAAKGTVSRIAPMLQEGAGVVTTRAHVQTVVTEYGVAELHGRTIAERATALIGIAPDFGTT